MSRPRLWPSAFAEDQAARVKGRDWFKSRRRLDSSTRCLLPSATGDVARRVIWSLLRLAEQSGERHPWTSSDARPTVAPRRSSWRSTSAARCSRRGRSRTWYASFGYNLLNRFVLSPFLISLLRAILVLGLMSR